MHNRHKNNKTISPNGGILLEIHFYKQSFLNSFNQLIPQAVLYSKDIAKKVLQELPHI